MGQRRAKEQRDYILRRRISNIIGGGRKVSRCNDAYRGTPVERSWETLETTQAVCYNRIVIHINTGGAANAFALE